MTKTRFDGIVWINDSQRGIVGFGGSSPSGSTSQTSSTQPWSGQEPYLTQAFQGAQNLYQNYKPQYFQGNTVAGFNDSQNTALQGITNQATSGEPITGAAMNFGTDMLNGAGLNNPGSALEAPFANGSMLPTDTNPYLKPTLDAISSSVTPQVQRQFVGGNSMSNPSAAYATAQGVASAEAPFLFNAFQHGTDQMLSADQNVGSNYNTNLGTTTFALGQAPSIQQLPYQDFATLFGAGSTEQQQQQQQINADIAKWNYGQSLPYQQLNEFLGQVGGGNYGSSTTMNTPYFSNPMGDIMGLGALGLGAYAAFSDSRLKDDIVPLDVSAHGLPLYAYRYTGGPKLHIGVMADEVARIRPAAVLMTIPGYAMVNYDLLREAA